MRYCIYEELIEDLSRRLIALECMEHTADHKVLNQRKNPSFANGERFRAQFPIDSKQHVSPDAVKSKRKQLQTNKNYHTNQLKTRNH